MFQSLQQSSSETAFPWNWWEENIPGFNMALDKFMRQLYNRAFCSGRELGPVMQEDLSVPCYHANS